MLNHPPDIAPGGREKWFCNLIVADWLRPSCEAYMAKDKRESFDQVLRRRINRREFFKQAGAAAVPLLVAGVEIPLAAFGFGTGPLGFHAIPMSTKDAVILPEGYEAQVLLRWGDAIFPESPDFSTTKYSARAQQLQFGFNCDFVGYLPLPDHAAGSSRRGLLVVNHEYSTARAMFADLAADGKKTQEQINAELAAHGISVVEIRQDVDQQWQVVRESKFNRRITAETVFELTGPAAGDALVKTKEDAAGKFVRGTLNNCSGGKTPWGTVLSGEENFQGYFANSGAEKSKDTREAKYAHARYGVNAKASERGFESVHDRFDVNKEPNEVFRFGYVVEVDPYDPKSVPKKRTALGRFRHEAATVVLAKNKRVVVYSGDDDRFEYIYKFVSRDRYNPKSRAVNAEVLDHGVLYAARFNDEGSGEWLPLVAGKGKLQGWTPAEISVKTRIAADLMGATAMDRPEDIEADPVSGKVYCVMTSNSQRGTAGKPTMDKANPRGPNRFGHIIEVSEAKNDHASERFTWEMFMVCGDPVKPEHAAFFAGWKDAGKVSPISSPDNITFDQLGNIWIATDGMGGLKANDGIFAVPLRGPERGRVRQFMSAPVDAEVCGPEFTPDHTTLFCAIQHPGGSNPIAKTTSKWPDGGVPRPSVIAITRKKKGVIGS